MSDLLRLLTKNEQIACFLSKSLICSFFAINERFDQKTDERITSPALFYNEENSNKRKVTYIFLDLYYHYYLLISGEDICVSFLKLCYLEKDDKKYAEEKIEHNHKVHFNLNSLQNSKSFRKVPVQKTLIEIRTLRKFDIKKKNINFPCAFTTFRPLIT